MKEKKDIFLCVSLDLRYLCSLKVEKDYAETH